MVIKSKEGWDITADQKAREILVDKLKNFVNYEWKALGYSYQMTEDETYAVGQILWEEANRISVFLRCPIVPAVPSVKIQPEV